MDKYYKRKLVVCYVIFFLIFTPSCIGSKTEEPWTNQILETTIVPAALEPVIFTSTPSSVPTRTRTPFSTPTLFPQLSDTPVICTAAPTTEVDVYITDILDSPRRDWFAAIVRTFSNESLVDSNGNVEEIDKVIVQLRLIKRYIHSETIIEEFENPDSMDKLPKLIAWSPDSKKLFYSHEISFHDGCFPISYTNGKDLTFYDLGNGLSSQILDYGSCYWITLSNDTNWAAYLDNDDYITLLNLSTGLEKKTFVSESTEFIHKTLYHTADLVWSPDNRYLAYTFMNYICGNQEDVRHSIIIVSADTLVHRTLIDEDENCPRVVKWQEDGLLLLEDEKENYYTVDPQINK